MVVSVLVRDVEVIKLLCSLLEVVVMYEVSISTCYEISQIKQTLLLLTIISWHKKK